MNLQSLLSNKVYKIIIIVSIGLIVIGLIIIAVWQGSKRPTTSLWGRSVLLQVNAVVCPNYEATLNDPNGDYSVIVPADAISSPGYISLTPREPELFPEAGETGWSRPMTANVELFDQNGNLTSNVSFTNPIDVCFTLDKSMWERYLHFPGGYKVQYYAEHNISPKWEDLPTTSHADQQQLYGQVSHLTLFALAINQMAETPALQEPYKP